MRSLESDALWEQAVALEQAGQLRAARDAYAELATRQRSERGRVHARVLERLALVLVQLRQPEAAYHFVQAAREHLAEHGDALGAFRMTVLAANLLLDAASPERAAGALSALEDQAGPFGPATPLRAEELAARAAAARWPGASAADLELARGEACAAFARLWRCHGRTPSGRG
ncbi:hypothetical protein WMF30_51585 [Sorangium sp. So ce134]